MPKPPAPRASALALAKTIDDMESLIFIKDDIDAKRLLVAWTLYNPTFTDIGLHPDTPPATALGLLWASQDEGIDFYKLGLIAGLPFLTTRRLFMRLTSARLVYPDGTLSQNTRIVIQAEMQGYLRGLWIQQRPPAGKDPAPASEPAKELPKAGKA